MNLTQPGTHLHCRNCTLHYREGIFTAGIESYRVVIATKTCEIKSYMYRAIYDMHGIATDMSGIATDMNGITTDIYKTAIYTQEYLSFIPKLLFYSIIK